MFSKKKRKKYPGNFFKSQNGSYFYTFLFINHTILSRLLQGLLVVHVVRPEKVKYVTCSGVHVQDGVWSKTAIYTKSAHKLFFFYFQTYLELEMDK